MFGITTLVIRIPRGAASCAMSSGFFVGLRLLLSQMCCALQSATIYWMHDLGVLADNGRVSSRVSFLQ